MPGMKHLILHKGMAPEDLLPRSFIDPTLWGKIAHPVDFARALIFLASDGNVFITGNTLNMSAGLKIH